jgi:hypothetical protein
MYRLRLPAGGLSDMVNLTRAKDALWDIRPFVLNERPLGHIGGGLARLPLDPLMGAKLERANALVGRASEPLMDSVWPCEFRWEPTGDGKDMPDLPAFLVRR